MGKKEMLVIVLLAFSAGLLVRGLVLPSQTKPIISEPKETKGATNESLLPTLDLPVGYFSNDDVHWGSAGNGDSGKITDYTQVSLKNKAVYQSYPTIITTIKSYSNEVKPLKSGNLGSNYLPTYVIEKIDKFDLDDDGISETIVTYNFAGRADGGSYQSDVIKGNNVIFSVQEDRASIVPADTTNGFYVEWGDTNESGGRCCPEGFYRTRFIFKNDKFEPVYEQKVKYLKIGKSIN